MAPAPRPPDDSAAAGNHLEVIDPGLLTLIEDSGRYGLAHLGVGRSGAADQPSYRLANRLVGNQPTAAALEITLGGVAFRFGSTSTVALTGAPAPVTVDGTAHAPNGPLTVRAGSTVRVGRPAIGLRTYLAVRGGIAVPPVLGSRSRDILAGLGPAPLQRGDRLPIGGEIEHYPNVDLAPVPALPSEIILRTSSGPREDYFTPDALARLTAAAYHVTPVSNRVGIRLHGEPIRYRARDLPPEGTVTGAVQIPRDGQPVLFLADHPVTGGYPVIAVVESADHGLAAQARPGQTIRFVNRTRRPVLEF